MIPLLSVFRESSPWPSCVSDVLINYTALIFIPHAVTVDTQACAECLVKNGSTLVSLVSLEWLTSCCGTPGSHRLNGLVFASVGQTLHLLQGGQS